MNRTFRSLLWTSLLLSLAVGMPARWVAATDAEPVAVVEKLEFTGVSPEFEPLLRDAIVTTEPGWKMWRADPEFDEETLREDLDRILAVYRDRGHYDALAEYSLEWHEDQTQVRIQIDVREGPPVFLTERDIDVSAADWLDADERAALLDDLPLVDGSVFGVEQYRAAKDALLKRVANHGYPAARVEGGVDVDLAAHSAQLAWTLHPGPEVRFGEVQIEGLEKVDEELVRRELTFDPGEVFTVDALEESRTAIYRGGLFRAVTLQPDRPPEAASAAPDPGAAPSVWPIVVRVEERSPRTIQVGVGYGTEDEFRGRISWRHRNWFGAARNLEFTAKYSSLVAGIEARFSQPWFIHRQLQLEADAAFVRETVPAFDANRASVGVGLIRSWENLSGNLLEGRIGYRFELADITQLNSDDLDTDGSSRIGALNFGITHSSIDDPANPRRGGWIDLAAAPALAVIGSEADFLRLRADARAFFPVSAAVIATRFQAETIQPFAGSKRDDVPVVSRLFGGGSGSVRGFAYQHLPPLDGDGDPIGGLSLVAASIELRFPIWRLLRGVAFVDAGQLSSGPFSFDAGGIYYSAGPGLRITTPVGSLGLDYGFLLRRPRGAGRGRIHFSVGATF